MRHLSSYGILTWSIQRHIAAQVYKQTQFRSIFLFRHEYNPLKDRESAINHISYFMIIK